MESQRGWHAAFTVHIAPCCSEAEARWSESKDMRRDDTASEGTGSKDVSTSHTSSSMPLDADECLKAHGIQTNT